MARKEITTPLDLKNLDNHNGNYEELYGLIDETDRRISEDMWEEIKDANTMKMLEPVQTAADLPSEAADKSLITVIDEQRVYGFVNGGWQPFSEIDLDPFSPFKDELQTMIDDHEATAQQLLSDMQTEHDNAVTEITGLTSDFNTDYQDKMNTFASDYKGKMDALSNEYQTKSSQLQSDYESYSAQLDTNRADSISDITSSKSSSLDEIEQAKQKALDSVTNENQDNWQKYKLTSDDGRIPVISLESDNEKLHALEPGNYYTTSTPIDMATSTAGFTYVAERGDEVVLRHIIYRPYNSHQIFIKRYYNEWHEWEPLGGTRVELYDGSASGTGTPINLKVPYDRFSELKIKFNRTGGTDIKGYDAESSTDISINYSNVFNDGSDGKNYEMILSKTSATQLTISSEVTRTFSGASSQNSGINILKVWGVL
ncbi:hypothetical protein [Staphylococcus pseudoxylosus]|uniref:hypothetical protein n=1 Tax=Staphylococcus pseudoxylosus TaxID=2282419 RepID=UPI002DBD9689|nr:hypothetical protein [Staphylococcus pseudoxylosus]MEB5782395.1 hypothetical protein [Staphylococcus pseudoxylosus]